MNSAHKNSHQENVKQVLNSTLQHKSQAYCYPCYYQQIVSKISPLLCPISFPIRVATSGSKENSHYVPCKSKKNDPNHEGKQAYSDVLAGCTNFLSKKTCLMYLAERLGVEVDRSTKCHPETAGEGIEYSWAERNQCIEGPSWQIRRERRTSTILSFDAYQVMKRMKRRLIKTDYMKVFPKSSSLYPGIF